jgi:hypothetical protein
VTTDSRDWSAKDAKFFWGVGVDLAHGEVNGVIAVGSEWKINYPQRTQKTLNCHGVGFLRDALA